MHWMYRIATYWLCCTASSFDAIVPGVRCKRYHGREHIHYCECEMDAERERVDEPRTHIISVTVSFNSLYNKIKIEIEREHTSGISSNPPSCPHVRVCGETIAAYTSCRSRDTVWLSARHSSCASAPRFLRSQRM
jgi:hypothetical protein